MFIVTAQSSYQRGKTTFTLHSWQCAVQIKINNCCGLTAPFSHDKLPRHEKYVTRWCHCQFAHFAFVCSASLLPMACPCLSNFEWWGPWGLVCPPANTTFTHLFLINQALHGRDIINHIAAMRKYIFTAYCLLLWALFSQMIIWSDKITKWSDTKWSDKIPLCDQKMFTVGWVVPVEEVVVVRLLGCVVVLVGHLFKGPSWSSATPCSSHQKHQSHRCWGWWSPVYNRTRAGTMLLMVVNRTVAGNYWCWWWWCWG